MENLSSELELVKSERDNLSATLEARTAEAEQLKQIIAESSVSSETRIEDYELIQEQLHKAQREITRLRQHLLEAEELHTQDILKAHITIDEYKIQIDRLESERSEFQDVSADRSSEISRLEEKCAELELMLEERYSENEQLNIQFRQNEVSLSNLQQVLQDFQSSQESELEFAVAGMKQQMAEMNTDLESWKEKYLSAEVRMKKIEKTVPDVDKLESELSQAIAAKRKLEFEGKLTILTQVASQAKAHLDEAMWRMRDGSQSSIDRRLISNLLVPFISTPRGDKRRYDMLNVIANVLDFTEEEKYVVGIGRRPSGGSNSVSPMITSPSLKEDPSNEVFSCLVTVSLLVTCG